MKDFLFSVSCLLYVVLCLVVMPFLVVSGVRGIIHAYDKAYESYDLKHATDDICTVSRKEDTPKRYVTYFSCTNGDYTRYSGYLFHNTKIGQKYNVKNGSNFYLISKI